MSNTKSRMEIFSFFNHDGICRHLEAMAKKGWMLERIANFRWHYRQIPPKAIRFAVSYYPKASEFDPEPTEGQLRFQEFCAHTGWQFACSSAQMQIFYNEDPDPIPIETEPELELAALHLSAKKSYLPSYWLLLPVGLMQLFTSVSEFLAKPLDWLAGYSSFFSGFCGILVLALCGVELAGYYLWHRRAEQAAKLGQFLSPPDTSAFQKAVVLLALGMLGVWMVNGIVNGDPLRRFVTVAMGLYLPALMLAVNGTKNYLKKKKASKSLNQALTLGVDVVLAFGLMGAILFGGLWAVRNGYLQEPQAETYEYRGSTFVLHRDELPLSLEDLTEVPSECYTRERNREGTFLLGRETIRQRPKFGEKEFGSLPRLNYTLTLVKQPWLYDFCRDWLMEKTEDREGWLRPEDPAPWGAREAYRLEDPLLGFTDKYLLCYEEVLVEISFDWEPTREQKAATGKAMGELTMDH